MEPGDLDLYLNIFIKNNYYRNKIMALIITPSTEQKIHVQGTAIELSSVYTRLEFGCRPNGIAMEISFYTYADRAAFLAGPSLPTDLPLTNLNGDIDPATQTQGLDAAHELAKTHFESLGYLVSIESL
jgi:hypothetical protein